MHGYFIYIYREDIIGKYIYIYILTIYIYIGVISDCILDSFLPEMVP